MIELIFNPTAGAGRSVEAAQFAAHYLKSRGIDFQIHQTDHPGHATLLAQQAAQRGAETVIALGGDGTVHETAVGLCGTRTALGILPCGTGNDFIKTAGIPKGCEAALDFLFSHPARPVNVGVINNSFFLNECGTGFDVTTLEYAEKAKRHMRGIWPYLYGVVCAIKNFKAVHMHIEIGSDVVLDGKFMVCAIGNGRFIGGGIPITPGAELTDGLFDVLVVDAVPNWKIPFYLPSLLKGTLYRRKPAHQYQASQCKISCPDMRMNVDGETFSMKNACFVCKSDALLLHW